MAGGSENIILQKTFSFAVRIVKVNLFLIEKKQVLRSGTSIGANAEEAVASRSRKEFIAKFGIVYSEAKETKYWLRLLKETELIDEKMFLSLLDDCEEIIKIVFKIIESSK
jgi:four helix bundle protein